MERNGIMKWNGIERKKQQPDVSSHAITIWRAPDAALARIREAAAAARALSSGAWAAAAAATAETERVAPAATERERGRGEERG